MKGKYKNLIEWLGYSPWKNNGGNPKTSQQKLNQQQVMEIIKSGEPGRILAKLYKVSHVTINKIRKNKGYKSVAAISVI